MFLGYKAELSNTWYEYINNFNYNSYNFKIHHRKAGTPLTHRCQTSEELRPLKECGRTFHDMWFK